LVPEVIKGLKAQGANDILVVVGGVVPEGDYASLQKGGVAAIFGPGSSVVDCAATIMQLLNP
jgi:methylmalonyl-CoA mutase